MIDIERVIDLRGTKASNELSSLRDPFPTQDNSPVLNVNARRLLMKKYEDLYPDRFWQQGPFILLDGKEAKGITSLEVIRRPFEQSISFIVVVDTLACVQEPMMYTLDQAGFGFSQFGFSLDHYNPRSEHLAAFAKLPAILKRGLNGNS